MISHHIIDNDKEAQACLHVLGMLAPRPYPVLTYRTRQYFRRGTTGQQIPTCESSEDRCCLLFDKRSTADMDARNRDGSIAATRRVYVNTLDNDVADLESRELDPDDWAISDCAWAQIETAFGPHDWDRFA